MKVLMWIVQIALLTLISQLLKRVGVSADDWSYWIIIVSASLIGTCGEMMNS